jgi:cytochrome c553
MRKTILVFSAFSAMLFTFLFSCNNAETKKEAAQVPVSNDSLIKRGDYLISAIGGCDDCHSPKKMGPQGPEVDIEKRFSGYPGDRPFGKVDSNIIKNGMLVFSGDLLAFAGPWGVSFAANISSDETGIGGWSNDQFKKALREGKWKGLDGSRPLLPPMPWQTFKNLTDDDISAIFAYLKSTKPVRNIVPSPKQPGEL